MFYRVPLIKSLNSKKDSKYNGQKRRKHKGWPWSTKHRKNKGNAKRGVSPRLQISHDDLDM